MSDIIAAIKLRKRKKNQKYNSDESSDEEEGNRDNEIVVDDAEEEEKTNLSEKQKQTSSVADDPPPKKKKKMVKERPGEWAKHFNIANTISCEKKECGSDCDGDHEEITISCKYCSNTHKTTRYKLGKNGSSNYYTHWKTEHKNARPGPSKVASGPLDRWTTGTDKDSAQDKPGFQNHLTKYFIGTCQPYSMADNKLFRNLFTEKKQKWIPGHTGMKLLIEKFVAKARLMRKEYLENISCVSICIDGWTSSNGYSFQGITVHFMTKDWKVESHLLDFKECPNHDGKSIAECLLRTLDFFNLSAKVEFIVADNAKNCNTMAQHVAKELGWKDWKKSRLRCLPHVINIACKSILSELGDDGEDDENYEGSAIKFCRHISKKIRSSPKEQKKFKEICKAAGVDPVGLILSTPTRWNSVYLMVKRMNRLKTGVRAYLAMGPVIGKEKLRDMTDSQWETLHEVESCLKVFYTQTLKISGDKYVSL